MIKEVHEGVHGIVVDSVTRVPLRAFIEVVGHDKDSSQIYSRRILGDYYRPIADGTYSFRVSCPGYKTKTYNNVHSTYGNPTELVMELVQGDSHEGCSQIEDGTCQIFPNPTTGIVNLRWNGGKEMQVNVYNMYGQLLQRLSTEDGIVDMSSYSEGTYILRIGGTVKKVVKY